MFMTEKVQLYLNYFHFEKVKVVYLLPEINTTLQDCYNSVEYSTMLHWEQNSHNSVITENEFENINLLALRRFFKILDW